MKDFVCLAHSVGLISDLTQINVNMWLCYVACSVGAVCVV